MRKIYRILGFIAVGVIFMACGGSAKNTTIVAGVSETVVIDDKNATDETNGTTVIDDKNATDETNVTTVIDDKNATDETNVTTVIDDKNATDETNVTTVIDDKNATDETNETAVIDNRNETEEPTTIKKNEAPVIIGLTDIQRVDDNRTISPFLIIMLEDKESDNLSLSIAIDNQEHGSLSTETIKSDTIDKIQTALRAIIFTPTANRIKVGEKERTTLTVTLNDGINSTTTSTVIVTKSVNDAPTDIILSTNYINQSAGTDATIGTLSSIDVDMNESFIYSLVSGEKDTNNTNFNISGDLLKTDDSTLLNAGIYSIRVNTDDGESNFSKEFNITVIDDSTLEKIAIDVKCTTPPTIDEYIELLKGDTIVKSENNTTVSIYHDENSNKRVCLDYGEAYIEREN